MYAYRRANNEERLEMLSERQARNWPWHAPPHFEHEENLFLITAACYEHEPILLKEERRTEFVSQLIEMMESIQGNLRAWVVLPNHYHLLACLNMDLFKERIGRLHNGKATQWNREDCTAGRKVWHRFSDRRIRGDRHYFATLNYIHSNPSHHRLTVDPLTWEWSSLPVYSKKVGPETLLFWQEEFPVDRYGECWDPV